MPLRNSQYDAVMRQYNRRQLKHENELAERKAQVYEKVPRIREIDSEISSSSAAQAKLFIKNSAPSMDEYKKKIALLKAEKDRLLKENGFPADCLVLTYDCPLCRDTGYINGEKCSCYMRETAKVLYDQSGLGDILERENFDTLTYRYYSRDPSFSKGGKTVYENMTEIVSKCEVYAAGFPGQSENMMFTGTPGCGKTFMTNCIAKAAMDKHCSVFYFSAQQLFDLFEKETFRRNQEDNDSGALPSDYVYDCDLLIIDDLGTEVSNSFTNSRLFSCINERLLKKKPTIISSNKSLAQLKKIYSERVFSRFLGYFTCLDFYGPDIRLEKYKKSNK